MQAILSVTVPFFALILAGYWAAQRGWLPLAAIPGLNTFVLFFALPCMLLRFGMNTPLAQLLDPVISSLYLVVAALVVTGVLILGRVLGTPRKDAAFAALVAAFPNSGFIGVPLLVALLGPAAAGPVICTMLLDMMLTTSACLALAQGGGPIRSANTAPGVHANTTAPGAGTGAAFLAALKAPLMNPLPWSIGLGARCRHWTWPCGVRWTRLWACWLMRPARWPCSPSERCCSVRARRRPNPHTPPRLRPPCCWAWWASSCCCTLAGVDRMPGGSGAGRPLSDLQVAAITLMAALPSASNVSMLAERYGANNGLVARIIMGSTTLAFITFTLWAWGFGVQPLH